METKTPNLKNNYHIILKLEIYYGNITYMPVIMKIKQGKWVCTSNFDH
jgi:hypothetical protein